MKRWISLSLVICSLASAEVTVPGHESWEACAEAAIEARIANFAGAPRVRVRAMSLAERILADQFPFVFTGTAREGDIRGEALVKMSSVRNTNRADHPGPLYDKTCAIPAPGDVRQSNPILILEVPGNPTVRVLGTQAPRAIEWVLPP